MDKFVCSCCGKCCKKFGKKGLPLFDFEVERIQKLAKERNIFLDIRSIEGFMDNKTGKENIALYGMFNEPCPFLRNNKCSIHEYRFLICRQFPLFSTECFKFGKGLPEFMDCCNFDCEGELRKFIGDGNKNPQEIENYLKETYGECFDSCLESNKETERIMEWLIKNGIKERD